MGHQFYCPEELVECFQGETSIATQDALIRTLATDSRRLSDHRYALFFAITGQRDGHDYLGEVYLAGIRNFVISDKSVATGSFPGSNFYIVSDTLEALQKLAACHRSRFTYPVVGIAGSNGKTIVKEWLYQLLSSDRRIVRSPKSYNSQIGVPLSVWQMDEHDELAVFEAGISTTGEMKNLERVIRPTIGILTNIGEAHQEGFTSREEKIREKLKLFRNADLLIYPTSYLSPSRRAQPINDVLPADRGQLTSPLSPSEKGQVPSQLSPSWRGQGEDFSAHPAGEEPSQTSIIPGKRTFSWGYDQADLQILQIETSADHSTVRALYKNEESSFRIPFSDQASIENSLTCLAFMLASGLDIENAASRLQHLSPVGMRLELKKGKQNCSIIDDSYSLDLSSLAIALDFLAQQNQHSKRSIILSDIPGRSTEDVYRSVSEVLHNKSIGRLVGVGESLSKYADLFQMDKQFFRSSDELKQHLANLDFKDETILIKGARSFQFEEISKMLIQRVHGTVLEINLNALQHNLGYYRSQLKPGTRIMAMVKAFSYGSGSFEIANLLEFNKIDYLAVAYADEGVALRNAGITLPIMVMSPDEEALETIIHHDLEPEIYNFRILNAFTKLLSGRRVSVYPIHVKIDTGMRRLGFMESEIDQLCQVIENNSLLKLSSVFSHLAGSSSAIFDDFSEEQIRLFNKIAARIEHSAGYPFLRHIANTSAIKRHPDAQMDMVRLGIGLYGIDPSEGSKSPLQTVTSLKTSISQIKRLKAGETVGYDRAGVMSRDGQIATVRIGYADGYRRAFGEGKGTMLVNGKCAPTVGKICMDMCMIDITGIEAKEGDEVIVFNDELRVEELAASTGTIPYEVLTGISDRVKRVYFYE